MSAFVYIPMHTCRLNLLVHQNGTKGTVYPMNKELI